MTKQKRRSQVAVRFGDRRSDVLHHCQGRGFVWIGRRLITAQTRFVASHRRDQSERRQIDIPIDIVDGLNRIVEKIEQERETDARQK